MLIGKNKLDEKAKTLNALGHSKRLAILLLLNRNKCIAVNDLVSELKLPQATVSQHLRILRMANIICGERTNKNICYSIINRDVLYILNNCLK